MWLVSKFKHMCRTIRRTLNGKVRRDTVLKFYKVTPVPCGLHGSDTWTLNVKTQSRIQPSEMRFLRSVLGLSLIHIWIISVKNVTECFRIINKLWNDENIGLFRTWTGNTPLGQHHTNFIKVSLNVLVQHYQLYPGVLVLDLINMVVLF